MAPSTPATSARFQRCHAMTAKWEGGWSNHPDDPGKATMYGVTQASWNSWCDRHGRGRSLVHGIGQAQAQQVFFDDFWHQAGCEALFAGVDLATYDAGVNSGVGRARHWLLASLDPASDHVKTVKSICAKRLSFVETLKIWKTFGKGWGNRIADIEATGVAWALAAMHDTHVVVQQLEDEAGTAQGKAQNQTKGALAAGGTGASAGAGIVADPGSAQHLAGWVLGAGLVIGVLVAVFLVTRVVINTKRAQAYRRVGEVM